MDIEMEVKADALDGAFDAVLAAEAVDELKASVSALKAQLDAQAVASGRLPLDGAKGADPARDAFVERYLRRGIDANLVGLVEMKSLSGASGGEGGYAVPREIDGAIASTLTSLSPIRRIASVVQTGTSGYRKLVATGATEAGWVGESAARPETDTRSFAEIAPPGGEPGDARRCDVRRRGLAGRRDRARVRGGGRIGLRRGQRDQPAQGLPVLYRDQ
jgi:HK97 family phage major capsid protein